MQLKTKKPHRELHWSLWPRQRSRLPHVVLKSSNKGATQSHTFHCWISSRQGPTRALTIASCSCIVPIFKYSYPHSIAFIRLINCWIIIAAYFGYDSFFLFLPLSADETNVPSEMRSLALSLTGILLLVGYIVIGILSDVIGHVQTLQLAMFATVALGLQDLQNMFTRCCKYH